MRFFILLPYLLFSIFLYPQNQIDKCVNVVYGKVVETKADNLVENAVVYINDGVKNIIKSVTDNKGNFSVKLPCDNGRYTATTTIENFTKSTKLIFTSRGSYKEHEVTLDIYPIREFTVVNGNKRVVVNQIDFLPDDFDITPEAEMELRKVYDILNKYPNKYIEIAFHSDSRGDERFIASLTQKRADACASYLINKGIDSERIIPKGYGSTKLLNECERGVKCSNEKHLQNKRSEFLVFKKDLSPQLAIFE